MREERWDFYKGFLIFSVIWGHCINALRAGEFYSVWIHIFLRSFDMPMFAFISGVFLRKSCQKRSCVENLLNKIGTILLPVVLWNIIYNLIGGKPGFYIGRFWFLWSIFFVSCVIILIDTFFKNYKLIQIIVFIITLVLFHTVINDSWNIGFLLFPCIIGYYYNSITDFIYTRFPNKLLYIRFFVIIAFCICQIFWISEYNVWNTGCNMFQFGTPIKTLLIICYRGIIGILGCFAIKIILDLLVDLGRKSTKLQIYTRGGVFSGRITLELYILQTLLVESWGSSAVVKVVHLLGFNPFTYNPILLGLVFAPILAVISLFIMALLVQIIKKIPIVGSYVFGISYSQFRNDMKLRKLK